MGKATCDVRGGLHALYAATLSGIDAPVGAMEHKFAAQALAHKSDFEYRALVDALLGAAAGGTATKTYPEIAASTELGGVRPVNTINLINRATTAQDVADIKKTLTTLSVNTFNPNPVYN